MADIIELLEARNVPFRREGQHHHVSAGWVGMDCPQCSPGTGKFRLGYSLRTGAVVCWVCGRVGGFGTLAEVLGVSRRDLDELLVRPGYVARAKPKGTLKIPAGVGDLSRAHREYLRGRGFDPSHIEQLWGVRGIGRGGRLAWRLWIPIHREERVVSWTTRAIVDDIQAKYVNARPDEEETPAKSVLYGADWCGHSVIVHEGPTDVWRTGPGAVATMGLVVSREQVRLLSSYPRRIVCFDSEPEAQRRARRLCEDLAAFPGETIRVQLDAADPGSASESETQKLRRLL